MFDPKNTQQAARFAIDPFQRIEINIGPNIDRSQGDAFSFSAMEGVGLYIERSDFPVLLALVNPKNTLGQSHVCRDGLLLSGYFKGFTLTHPPMNVPGTLSMILVKTPDALVSNELATPASRLPLVARAIVNTGVAQTLGIYVPPGVRALNALNVAGPALTITNLISVSATRPDGTTLAAPTNLQTVIAGVAQVYNASPNYLQAQIAQLLGGAFFAANFSKLVLPTQCAELVLTIAGTGLSNALTLNGWWE